MSDLFEQVKQYMDDHEIIHITSRNESTGGLVYTFKKGEASFDYSVTKEDMINLDSRERIYFELMGLFRKTFP